MQYVTLAATPTILVDVQVLEVVYIEPHVTAENSGVEPTCVATTVITLVVPASRVPLLVVQDIIASLQAMVVPVLHIPVQDGIQTLLVEPVGKKVVPVG
jgi:hypothetical protein